MAGAAAGNKEAALPEIVGILGWTPQTSGIPLGAAVERHGILPRVSN